MIGNDRTLAMLGKLEEIIHKAYMDGESTQATWHGRKGDANAIEAQATAVMEKVISVEHPPLAAQSVDGAEVRLGYKRGRNVQ